MALIIRPLEHAGLICFPEAIEAIEQGFAAWGRDPSLNVPRQVLHKWVRLAVHQSFAPALGAVGLFAPARDERERCRERQRHSQKSPGA